MSERPPEEDQNPVQTIVAASWMVRCRTPMLFGGELVILHIACRLVLSTRHRMPSYSNTKVWSFQRSDLLDVGNEADEFAAGETALRRKLIPLLTEAASASFYSLCSR